MAKANGSQFCIYVFTRYSTPHERQAGSAMRKMLQWAWVHFLYFSGCLWWARFSLSKAGAIVVLTFLEDQTTTNSQDGLIVRGKTFDQLCAYLKSGYQVVSVETSTPGETSKRLKVACTFDDGWEDNYRNALPYRCIHEHRR